MVEHHVWLVGELVSASRRLTPAQLEARIEISEAGDPMTWVAEPV